MSNVVYGYQQTDNEMSEFSNLTHYLTLGESSSLETDNCSRSQGVLRSSRGPSTGPFPYLQEYGP